MPYPTLRNQYIANRVCVDARYLEQLRNQFPPLSLFTIAGILGLGERCLANEIAAAPTEAALAAIVPLRTTNV